MKEGKAVQKRSFKTRKSFIQKKEMNHEYALEEKKDRSARRGKGKL